jgi:hypothetical protein
MSARHTTHITLLSFAGIVNVPVRTNDTATLYRGPYGHTAEDSSMALQTFTMDRIAGNRIPGPIVRRMEMALYAARDEVYARLGNSLDPDVLYTKTLERVQERLSTSSDRSVVLMLRPTTTLQEFILEAECLIRASAYEMGGSIKAEELRQRGTDRDAASLHTHDAILLGAVDGPIKSVQAMASNSAADCVPSTL